MKPLDEVKFLKEKESQEYLRSRIADNLLTQIKIVERIIENNGSLVTSPLAYNSVSGLLEQLKAYAPAIFTAQDSWLKAVTQEKSEYSPVPLINDDGDTLVAKNKRKKNDRQN